MNIFVLQESPIASARDYCNKHLPKMCVELLQMCGSAVIRHGATPDMMPLTKKGTPLKGGYHNHPCTRWVGETRTNFLWAITHGQALCYEYSKKYGKTHFCEAGIRHLDKMADMIPEGDLTPFALAMPNEFRPNYKKGTGHYTENLGDSHASGDEAVQAYRRYYHSKEFASWEGRPVPVWWLYSEGNGMNVRELRDWINQERDKKVLGHDHSSLDPMQVTVAFKTPDGEVICSDIVSVCINGNTIQLNEEEFAREYLDE